MTIYREGRFYHLIEEAQAAAFSGWDFSWLEGRLIEADLHWNYPRLVKNHFDGIISLLDQGTGGGELLASLMPLPPDTHATEAYSPNQIIAAERLTPLGVKVHPIQGKRTLPFSDNSFDLIINRHDSFDAEENFRLLKPGGYFITQQVGGLDNLELNQVLEDKLSFPFINWGLAAALTSLYEAGFEVERAEKAALLSTFKDIGAVAYYLKAIPWQVEGFSVKTHSKALAALHEIIERQGGFQVTTHRFLVIAQRPKS